MCWADFCYVTAFGLNSFNLLFSLVNGGSLTGRADDDRFFALAHRLEIFVHLVDFHFFTAKRATNFHQLTSQQNKSAAYQQK